MSQSVLPLNHRRKLAVVGALVSAAIALAGCSSGAPSAVPNETKTSTPSPSPTPTPTPTAEPGSSAAPYPYGTAVDMTVDGVEPMWTVTVNEPTDLTVAVRDQYAQYPGVEESGVAPEGMSFIGIPATVTRLGAEPMDPWDDLTMELVVENRTLSAEAVSMQDLPTIEDVGELYTGGTADFTEIFLVPTGSVVTVLISSGLGEMSQGVFFGAPIAPDGEESSTPDVESMKYLWRNASDEQHAESLATWGVNPGEEVSDSLVQTLITEAEEVGIILDEAEAREFLEWVVKQ